MKKTNISALWIIIISLSASTRILGVVNVSTNDVVDYRPPKDECEECSSCADQTKPENKCISFIQGFGRTPWIADAPKGSLRVYEYDPTFPILDNNMLCYDHPMERKIIYRNDTDNEVRVQNPTGEIIIYKDGMPCQKFSGKNLQCRIGEGGLIVEQLEDMTQVVYGPDNAVQKLTTARGVEILPSDLGITLIKDLDGIRQVWSRTDGLMDVTMPPTGGKLVSWYPPSAVSASTNEFGFYTFSGLPAKTFTFQETFYNGREIVTTTTLVNGDTAYEISYETLFGLTLEERRGTEFSFSYEWRYDYRNRDWTFTRGAGDDLITDQLSRSDLGGTSTVTRVRMDAAGKVAFRRKDVFLNDLNGVTRIKTESGEGVTTYKASRIDYGVNMGRLSSRENAYGGSTAINYDSYGRLTNETETVSGSISQVTTHTYNAPGQYGFVDRRPTRTVVTQDGVAVSETAFGYSYMSESTTRTDPKTDVSLTTVNYLYSPVSANPIERGRVKLTVNPDGSAMYYTYAAGENGVWTETATQGYWYSDPTIQYVLPPAPEAFFNEIHGKSARTVKTHDFRGDVVRTESYVHTGSEFTLAGWTTNSYNIMHKQLGSTRHDGTSEMSNWICTGPVWQRNADGTTVTNTFDTAKRIKTSTHYTPFGNVTTTNSYNADGQIVSRSTATNGVPVGCGVGCGSTYSEFDTQGRTVLAVDAMGRTNRTSYSADNRTITHTDPAGAVVVDIYDTDGSLLSRTGTVMRAEFYTKGVDAATVTHWEKTTYGSPTGVDYTKSFYNALGQLVLQERPGFGGATLKTVYTYNTKGQLESESREVEGGTGTYDLPVTVYAYSQLGDRASSTQTVASVSRIQSSDSAFTLDNGIVQQTSISVQSCSDATIPAITNSSITRLYPLGSGLLAESRSRDARGNETVQKVVQDPTTYIRTTTVSNATSVLPAISISLAGLTTSSTDQHGCTTTNTYDALMRQTLSETRSGASNERLTGSYTHYNSLGQVDYTEDALGNRTVYGYEPATGRRISTTQCGQVSDPALTTYTAFDAANRTLATWGATYPVAYEYDTAGRMTAMYTYRGTNETEFINSIRQSGNNAIRQSADCTRWLYDEATGLLTNKLYADNRGPSYSYTALGQLSTRKWARLYGQGSDPAPLLTSYAYDSFGGLTNTAYSDGTPSIAFTYNALGQMKTVTDASGTRTIDYAADGQMIAEALSFNTSLFTLHEKYDILGRNAGYALSNEVALITGTMQNFDLYGRLNQFAVDGISGAFTYGYLEGSHLQKALAMPNGVTRTFGYEPNRDLLTMIVHSNSTDRLVQRDFTFDGLGRLENRTLFRASETPVQPDAFAYNSLSELTNAIYQITQSGTNAIRQFSYDFDPIGNRNSATEFGTNKAYAASALNQYTSINPINPVNPVENFDPEFDLDGNQTLLKTTTGIWHVWYNAENRPIIFSNDTTVVEMAYDYMGRRCEYKETINNTLTRHERYLYRNYLQIAALDMLNSGSVKHTIVWDPTEPIATRPLALQVGANAYFYSFDQVKNVTELFDSAGALAATYDYSPFGQVTSFQITQSGNNALTQFSNPLTFSSEVHDSTLGLQYYNYRHLNLLDGRWGNRDPIGEHDGKNLFCFVVNSPIKQVDVRGLAIKTEIVDYGDNEVDWPEWYKVHQEFGTKPQVGVHGITAYDVKVYASGKLTSDSCGCTFNITKLVFYTGTWIRNDQTEEMKIMSRYHEVEGHRKHAAQYNKRFTSALTEERTCVYSRGIGIFKRPAPRTQQDCDRYAEKLKNYIGKKYKRYGKSVGEMLDRRAGELNGSSLDKQKDAAEIAAKEVETMNITDWECGDESGYFW